MIYFVTFALQHIHMAAKQLNFRIEEDILNKLKYIAWFDRDTITDTYINAVSEKIDKWEKKNGKITDEMIEKAKIK